MNATKVSATLALSNFYTLLFVSSPIWGCVETPAPEDDWRAGDATGSIYIEPSDPPDLPEAPEEPEDPNEQIPPPDEEGCHAIYAQDLLPTFELTIDEDVWDQIAWEWEHGAEQDAKGLDPDPYHPLAEFRYGDIVITNAEIRLRGNPDYWWDDPNKWQFQISFDNVDKKGHFLGLEVLAFDAATYNRHMLRDRLALSIIRDMGVIAPCANHARLNINGEYYGIFTNLEKIDKLFLERVFDDPSGDLWKRQNWSLQTNKKTANDDRLDALNAAKTIEELETYLDVEQALTVYAAEAIIPDSDGGWAGGKNFYLYDDPLSGVFKLIPWDMDNTFEVFDDGKNGEYPNNPDPVVWHKKVRYHGRPYYELALEDEDWFWVYIDIIRTQFEAAYDVAVLHEKIDTWTAQIQESVFEDTNKPYSDEKYLKKIDELKDYVEERHDWMEDWLECWEDGGVPDKKGYCKEND
jgi:hypothetical protein